jgi:single-strand DNA-binding protein
MNNTIMIGNLTKDPELRMTTTEKSVCNFTIAVNRKFKKEEVDYFDVAVWGKLGELCDTYLSKGKKVCVVGRIENHPYTDKEGNKVNKTMIQADEVEFLSPKTEEEPKKENQERFATLDDSDLDSEIPF